MYKKYSIEWFKEKIKEEFKERRIISLEKNEMHDNYVFMIAATFYKRGNLSLKTGFKTILLEPLFDVEKAEQPKNFDLMIHNHQYKQSLFIEIKSSYTSISSMLEDFKEAKEAVLKNFDKELSQKINLKLEEHSTIEFVLILPKNQSISVKTKINTENREEIIIWEISTITNEKKILSHDIQNLVLMLSKKRTHKNKNLRECLHAGEKIEPLRMFNSMLNSDPYQKIEYFVPLIKATELKEFNFYDIKNRILDADLSFGAYQNPESAKEFTYKILVKELSNMGVLKKIKENGGILKNKYSLKIDQRLSEPILKRRLKSEYMKKYLESKEVEITREALKMHQDYKGQKRLMI